MYVLVSFYDLNASTPLSGKIRDLSQELKLFTEEKDENQGNTSYLLNEMKGNEEIYQQYKNNFREMEEKIKNLLCTSSEAL